MIRYCKFPQGSESGFISILRAQGRTWPLVELANICWVRMTLLIRACQATFEGYLTSQECGWGWTSEDIQNTTIRRVGVLNLLIHTRVFLSTRASAPEHVSLSGEHGPPRDRSGDSAGRSVTLRAFPFFWDPWHLQGWPEMQEMDSYLLISKSRNVGLAQHLWCLKHIESKQSAIGL